MISRFLAILVAAMSPVASSALELSFSKEMTLSDFYSQGIYPSFGGPASASFSLSELSLSAGPEKELFTLKDCYGTFSFSVRNELRYGMIVTSDPTTVEEATKKLKTAAGRLGVEPRYGKEHPDAPPSNSGTKWTSMAVNYQIPESKWTLTLSAKRSEEMVFLSAFLSKPISRRERTINMHEWLEQKLLKTPEEWSHLPLRKEYYSPNLEASDFLHRVASYDAEGNLLPKHKKRLEEIEKEAAQKVADRLAKREANRGLERTKTLPNPSHVRPSTRIHFWLIAGGVVFLFVVGLIFYLQKREFSD